jgi:HK97 family phage prohead protease
MPYSENSQLPEAVRNSLSDSDQTKWRTIFNEAYEGDCNKNDRCAAKVAWSQLKKNARYFAGWASAEVIDRQGDVIEVGAFRKTMDLFMQLGSSIIDQHSNRKVGQYINYEFRDKTCGDGTEKPGVYMEGVIYKGQRIHDDVWEKVKSGEYSGLSIGADPLETKRECDAKTCWNAIKNIDLFEISVVEVPANQEALIDEINHVAKSDMKFIGDPMAEEPKSKPVEKAADTEDGAPAVEEPILAKIDEILSLLKGLDNRMTELEKKLVKEEKPPVDEEEDDEEEDMDKKSAEPAADMEAVVEKAVEKALEKRMKDKEPDTPRPDLKKHELVSSPLQGLTPEKLAKMDVREIDALVDSGEEKPW